MHYLLPLCFQNQTQTATSLQVFHNLGSLEQTVDKVISSCYENLLNNVKSALDVTALSQQRGHMRTGEHATCICMSGTSLEWGSMPEASFCAFYCIVWIVSLVAYF